MFLRCNWRSLHLMGFLYASLMLGVALYLQLVDFILPCRICVYLRVLTLLYVLTNLLAIFHQPVRWGKKVYGGLLLFYSLGGVMLSLYLLTLQRYPFTAALSCEQGGAERFSGWPLEGMLNVLFNYYGDCEAMAASAFGISLASLSLMCFSILLVWETIKVRLK